jgi:hypothetical protein
MQITFLQVQNPVTKWMQGPVPSQIVRLHSEQIFGQQFILALIHLLTIASLVSALEQTLLVISGPTA